MEQVRIYEIPDCKMVSSGKLMFGEDRMNNFHKWFSSLPRKTYPYDFLFGKDDWLHWLYIYEESMDIPGDYEIIDFKGGLYAVCCDIDQKTDVEALDKLINDFLVLHGFDKDESRYGLGNIMTPPSAYEVLGYYQMDYWYPIKPKVK